MTDSTSEEHALAEHVRRTVRLYEDVKTKQHGKPYRANRTWPMFTRHGILGAVERLVTARRTPDGFVTLTNAGFHDQTIEALVLHYAPLFRPQIVDRATARLDAWRTAQ